METRFRIENVAQKKGPMMRQDVYDVMKGLLIMLVVLGHLFAQGSQERQVIYWFHMPVFFMLTGMLTNWDMDGRKFLSKRIKSYVIPYICWMLLFVFVAYLLYEDSIVKGVAHTLIGGGKNKRFYSFPLWFINCLFVSSLTYKFLYKSKYRTIIVVLGWLLFHLIYSIVRNVPALPWSIENIPFVMFYFELGVLMKRILERKTHLLNFCVTALCTVVLIILGHYKIFSYELDMRYADYPNVLIDTLIPMIFFLLVYETSYYLCKINVTVKVFCQIGLSSLTIMYVHGVLIYWFRPQFNDAFLFITILLISIIIHQILQRSKSSSLLFLGR